jgi:hypothetical protein
MGSRAPRRRDGPFFPIRCRRRCLRGLLDFLDEVVRGVDVQAELGLVGGRPAADEEGGGDFGPRGFAQAIVGELDVVFEGLIDEAGAGAFGTLGFVGGRLDDGNGAGGDRALGLSIFGGLAGSAAKAAVAKEVRSFHGEAERARLGASAADP